NGQRECENGDRSEPGRLEKLSDSELEILDHKNLALFSLRCGVRRFGFNFVIMDFAADEKVDTKTSSRRFKSGECTACPDSRDARDFRAEMTVYVTCRYPDALAQTDARMSSRRKVPSRVH